MRDGELGSGSCLPCKQYPRGNGAYCDESGEGGEEEAFEMFFAS